MTYNSQLLMNITNIWDVFNYANVSTSNNFTILAVVGIFFIMVMINKKSDFVGSLIVSTAIMTILSFILTAIGLLSIIVPFMFLIAFALTFLLDRIF